MNNLVKSVTTSEVVKMFKPKSESETRKALYCTILLRAAAGSRPAFEAVLFVTKPV